MEVSERSGARDLVAEFVALRHNPFTRDGYSAALERFAGFCAARELDPVRADVRLVAAFRDELAAVSAAGTVRFELAAVSSFFRWLRAQDLRDDNPAARLERPPRASDHSHTLTAPEALRLLAGADPADQRPLALCSLFLLYGLPTSSVAQLDAADVRPSGLEGAQLRARFHGGRRQLVALAGPARSALIAQAAAVDAAGPLFPGDGQQGRSGRHTLCEEVARAARTRLPDRGRITPQVLRATHQAAARAVLTRTLADALSERGWRRPPDDLAELVWDQLRRQAVTASLPGPKGANISSPHDDQGLSTPVVRLLSCTR